MNEESDIQGKETAPVPPGWRQRWLYAIPLFVMFILLALFFRVLENFEEMFKELNLLDTLPMPTLWLFKIRPVIAYTFAPAMYVIAWLYLALVAKNKRRMVWFSIICVVLTLAIGVFVVIALFLPLLVDMQQIGK